MLTWEDRLLPVRVVIHSLHITWLQNTVGFREILLSKGLANS